MNNKICQMVTDRIVAQLSNGVIPWERPWYGTNNGPISHSTGKPYSLLNQMLLCDAGEYITYNQCCAEGGCVKRGSHGRPVVFWKQVPFTDTDDNGKPVEKLVPMLRYYTVFHIDDCEGISPKYDTAELAVLDPVAEAEQIVVDYEARENIAIHRHTPSNKAYYSPTRDCIAVPCLEQYKSTSEYYSTLFHEMVHSTGHPARLGRFGIEADIAAFGSKDYSKEELIAETGAAALVNICGIETERSSKNNAAYCQSWLRALNNDIQMLISASGKAQKAVDYITNVVQ